MARLRENGCHASALSYAVLAGGLVSLSAAACGGLADDRRGEPVGMFGASGGSSRQGPPPGGACNPLIGNGCEMPAGCNPSSSPQCRPPTAGSGGETPRVPSCEENPLLPGCGVPPQSDPPRPPEPEPGPAPDSDARLLEAAAANVLLANCGQCHGPIPELADIIQGGLGDIQDLRALTQAGYIVDCSAEGSQIVQVMRSGSMPPPLSGFAAVTEADLSLVEQAIEFGCTDSERLCAGAPALPGCAVVLAERALERNCGACHGDQARENARRQGTSLEGMSYIDDMTSLIGNNQVLPCRPESSPVLMRARDGSMPPPATRLGTPLIARDDATVASFIDGLCPGPASPEDTQQLEVERLLSTYCGECHGRRAVELGQVQGNFDNVESVDFLIQMGFVTPCLSDNSVLLGRLRDGGMPPPASLGPRPSAAEIQLIADFVDRPCAGP